jgi:chromatin remodeling complex protein RSC6
MISNFTKWNSVNVMGVDGLAGLPQPSITHVVGNTTNSPDTILSQSVAQTPAPLITPLQPTESVVNSNDDESVENSEDDQEEEDSDEDDRSLFANEEEEEEEEEDNNEQENNSQDEDEADDNDDDEDTSGDDGDDCGIGDEGFPFC